MGRPKKNINQNNNLLIFVWLIKCIYLNWNLYHHLIVLLLPTPINVVSCSSLNQNTIWILTGLSFSSFSKTLFIWFSSCQVQFTIFVVLPFSCFSWPNLWSGFYHDPIYEKSFMTQKWVLSWPNSWKKLH